MAYKIPSSHPAHEGPQFNFLKVHSLNSNRMMANSTSLTIDCKIFICHLCDSFAGSEKKHRIKSNQTFCKSIVKIKYASTPHDLICFLPLGQKCLSTQYILQPSLNWEVFGPAAQCSGKTENWMMSSWLRTYCICWWD